MKIDAIAQLFARLEVRHIFGRHFYSLSRFGIAPQTRGPVAQTEAAKSAYFNALTTRKILAQRLEYSLHRHLHIGKQKL